MKSKFVLLLAATALHGSATAAVIFSDNFDRANSRNVDASMSGITDNTGSNLTIDTVYTHPFLDPNNQPPTYGVQDGNAANGGGAQILTNTLQLATGAGTSNILVNHNFVNPAIASNGNFTVSVDITSGYGGTTTGQGGGFGVGMTLPEAMSAGDAISGTTKMQDGLSEGTFNGASNVSIADFWVVLRGNGSLIWGGLGNAVTDAANSGPAFFGTAAVGSKTGTISVAFSNFSNFDAGTSVSYAVSFNGTAVTGGTGTFTWSDTNANYIGLDARDGTGVNFDNFSVQTVPEPSAALLGLAGLCGLLRRRR